MLHRHLLNTPARIGVGENRAAVATSFLEKYGYSCCDWFQQKASTRKEYLTHSSENAIGVIILDDGFQVPTFPNVVLYDCFGVYLVYDFLTDCSEYVY